MSPPPLPHEDSRPERLVLGVLVAGLLCAVAIAQPFFQFIRCPLLNHVGVPCLTCGGRRATRALLSGDLVGAFAWNPLVVVGVGLLGLVTVYCLMVVCFRAPKLRLDLARPFVRQVLVGVGVLVCAANWIYLIWRFASLSEN